MATSPPVVYLHIGAMKTGTSFLQRLMSDNREELAEAGYLFPGRRWRDQDLATRDILGMGTADPEMSALTAGKWDELGAQMLSHRGLGSIFSMEFLSFATPKQAARVVTSLAGARVHVILTVRDTAAALPAQWQTSCRNGGTASWPDFARSARRSSAIGRLAWGQGAAVFRQTQGVPGMLAAWGAAVPADRLHVVTVPASDADPLRLWERFAGVLGLDPSIGAPATGTVNPSLGQPSAELLRLLNTKMGRVPTLDHAGTVKKELATNILAPGAAAEPRAKLDLTTWRFAVRWNRHVREAIEASAAHVVGDLGDLPATLPPDVLGLAEPKLRDPSPDDVLTAAATARAGLVALVARRASRLARLEGRAADSTRSTPSTPSTEWGPQPQWQDLADPVGAAVTELAAMTGAAIVLQRRLRRARTASL